MNTIPDTFHRRAQWQNNAINHADAYLLAADMPSYSEVVTQLADMLETNRTATEATEVISKARELVDRACGPGPTDEQRAAWFQLIGRMQRPRDPCKVAREVCPTAQCEVVGRLGHIHIKVPADQLDAVRVAVERHRQMGVYVEYLPLETVPQ
jgi:hypothetical protein